MSETKSAAYSEGYAAAGRGESASKNPYTKGTADHRSWSLGWCAGCMS